MQCLVTGKLIDHGPSSCLYSAECLEGLFCELRLEGVLRSWASGDIQRVSLPPSTTALLVVCRNLRLREKENATMIGASLGRLG